MVAPADRTARMSEAATLAIGAAQLGSRTPAPANRCRDGRYAKRATGLEPATFSLGS